VPAGEPACWDTLVAVYIGLGSNLGNRRANMAMALRMLAPLVRVEVVSPLYESAPQPRADQPNFLNAAARVITGLTPQLLLRHLLTIERDIGRRPSPRWSPRPIDLDIVLFDDQVLDGPELEVPHARMLERAFVLRPLLDIDPDLTHPLSKQRLDVLLPSTDAANLRKVAEVGWETLQG
jgi:2-amino-4-hydroxy-6-hydroxymethyldihydropteridine diphosphokinase